MHNNQNIIRTTIDPNEIRAKHTKIKARDGGEFETTAFLEIFNEDFDLATKTYTLQIGLNYPSRSPRATVSLAIPARQDGKTVAIKPPDYMMTQEDFDAAIVQGKVINVPARH